MLWSPVGTQENSFTPHAGWSFRDGLIHPVNKDGVLNYSNCKSQMVFTLLFQVTKCYADFGVKKYAVSLQKELHYRWITILEGRKKKWIRVRSYLQSFQVYQSWRTAIKEGQTLLPLCSPNLVHSTCC